MDALYIFIGIIAVIYVLSLIGRRFGLLKEDEEVLRNNRNKNKLK